MKTIVLWFVERFEGRLPGARGRTSVTVLRSSALDPQVVAPGAAGSSAPDFFIVDREPPELRVTPEVVEFLRKAGADPGVIKSATLFEKHPIPATPQVEASAIQG